METAASFEVRNAPSSYPTIADDVRRREVGPRNSSCEAGEQRGAIRCGVGGAKDGDQGECGPTKHTPGSGLGESVSQALARIRQAAKQRKKERFTSLLHHVSVDLLRLSFFALKKDASPGVAGLARRDYETSPEGNLEDLPQRVHRGAYRALPSRRQYIPKADGRKRPIAICALEDKIVQRAIAAVLNTIYEEDFLGFSYGFRPQRSQHDALDALMVGNTTTKVNWILEVDIRSFFDEVNREWLAKFLEHRIADPRILRLIQKWLKAGVL